MCGIFGYYNHRAPRTRREILECLLTGLRRLEYRGYDSAGISLDVAPLGGGGADGSDSSAGQGPCPAPCLPPLPLPVPLCVIATNSPVAAPASGSCLTCCCLLPCTLVMLPSLLQAPW